MPEGKTSVVSVAFARAGQTSPSAGPQQAATSLGSAGRGRSRLTALGPRGGPAVVVAGRPAGGALCWGDRGGLARGVRSRARRGRPLGSSSRGPLLAAPRPSSERTDLGTTFGRSLAAGPRMRDSGPGGRAGHVHRVQRRDASGASAYGFLATALTVHAGRRPAPVGCRWLLLRGSVRAGPRATRPLRERDRRRRFRRGGQLVQPVLPSSSRITWAIWSIVSGVHWCSISPPG